MRSEKIGEHIDNSEERKPKGWKVKTSNASGKRGKKAPIKAKREQEEGEHCGKEDKVTTASKSTDSYWVQQFCEWNENSSQSRGLFHPYQRRSIEGETERLLIKQWTANLHDDDHKRKDKR